MLDEELTILIPTSPIPSHPSTLVIDKAIESVRAHFPLAPIIIMVDGIRPEQDHYRVAYDKYQAELMNKMLTGADQNLVMLPFRKFTHQAVMTAETMELVKTPLVMFVEHDTFFLPELRIDWEGIFRVIKSGALNMVGFHCHWEPWVLPSQEPLMLDKERYYIDGVPFLRTWQFSARPHVASAQFYRDFLFTYFRPESRTFIEDRMYAVIMDQLAVIGEQGWDDWRMAYYAPEGSIRRTWTDDGRAGDQKFPVVF